MSLGIIHSDVDRRMTFQHVLFSTLFMASATLFREDGMQVKVRSYISVKNTNDHSDACPLKCTELVLTLFNCCTFSGLSTYWGITCSSIMHGQYETSFPNEFQKLIKINHTLPNEIIQEGVTVTPCTAQVA